MGLFDAAEAAITGLAARVAALESGTVEPPVEPPWEYTPSQPVTVFSGDVVERKSFANQDYPINFASGAHSQAVTGATVRDCLLTDCSRAVKIGSGPTCSGITIERVKAVRCGVTVYLANVTDSVISDVDGEGLLYVERSVSRCTFRRCTFRLGGQYSCQLYNESGAESTGLLFEDCTFDARGGGNRALFVLGGYRDVTFRRCEFFVDKANEPVIVLNGARDVLFDGFEAEGGYGLVHNLGGCSGVQVRDGVYRSSAPFVVGGSSGITVSGVVRA